MKRLLKILPVTVIFLATQSNADVNVKMQDLNGDGKVSFEEFLESHNASITRNAAFIERHRPIFDTADINKDGFVDSGESQGPSGKSKANKSKKKS